MDTVNFKTSILELEELIVQGQIRPAALKLAKLGLEPQSRQETLSLARVERRLGLPEQSLKRLATTVRPKAKLLKPATAEEKAEYAVSLHRVGSSEEAAALLKEISEETLPEVLLYRAVLLFAKWNYKEALPLLEKFLKIFSPESSSYALGEINLAAAYVYERHPLAPSFLKQVRKNTFSKKQYLLYGNSLEISAQYAIAQKDFSLAESFLDEAEAQLQGVKVLDYLWLMKWKKILEAFKTNSTAPLEELKAEALTKKHWETLREIDFYKLRINFDERLFRRLYFGTKSPFYRQRLRETFPEASLPTEVGVSENWLLKEVGSQSLDLFSINPDELAPGTLSHALLIHFFSDWYKGFRSGELYSILFPGEYFNVETSMNRVHQSLSRFRKELEKSSVGLEITQDESIYQLRITAGVFKVPRDLPEPHPLAIRLHLFKQRNVHLLFNSEDVQTHLEMSKANANRLIQSWLDQGYIRIQKNQKPRLYEII